MEVGTLEERVRELTLFNYALETKITSSNPGWLDDLLDSIKKILDNILSNISDALADLIESIIDPLEDIIDSIKGLIESFVDTIEEIVGGIISTVGEFFNSIAATISEAIASIISSLDGIIGGFVETINGIAKTISEALDAAMKWIGEQVMSIASAIWDTLQDIGKKIGEFAMSVWGVIQEAAQIVKEAVVALGTELSEKIRVWLHSLIEQINETLAGMYSNLVEIYNQIVQPAVNFFTNVKDKTWSAFLDRSDGMRLILRGLYEGNAGLVENGIDKITRMEDMNDLTSFFLHLGFIAAIFPPLLQSYASPIMSLIMQRANANLPASVLPMDTLVECVHRGLLSESDFYDEMAKGGYSHADSLAYLETRRPLPSPGTIQDAYLRGVISEDEHDNLLRIHGYAPKDIALFKALYWIIPSPPDLISMAVKEAFSPEVAERFGQYEDFPEIFAEWAEKQGISREWAERYWAAHWGLPSPQMGYEMLHRGIISEEELKLLLRALDIMPFWREKLIAISYAPFTRVDVRRMYQLGILDREGVKRAYLDLGYDNTKAEALTEFTIRYYTEEDKTELDEYKNLTRSIYISAYKKGVLDRKSAKDYLTSISYTEDDAELLLAIADAELYTAETREDPLPKRAQTLRLILDAYKRGLYSYNDAYELLSSLLYADNEIEYYLSLSDYENELAVKTEVLETVKELYITRTINKPEATSWLGRLYVSSKEMENLFTLWDIGRELRTRKPTEAQFRYALQRGLISKEEYEEELRGLGYPDKYVTLLSTMATGK